jgi:hypothetical protein
MVTRTRRRLLVAARALRDKGTLQPGVENADVFRGASSDYFISEDKSPWQEIYARQLDASVRPLAPRRALRLMLVRAVGAGWPRCATTRFHKEPVASGGPISSERRVQRSVGSGLQMLEVTLSDPWCVTSV